jgi:hypothetical protein
MSKGPRREPGRMLVQQHEGRPLPRGLAAVCPPIALAHNLAVDRHVVVGHRASLAVGCDGQVTLRWRPCQ